MEQKMNCSYDLTVIVVTYNSETYIRECLGAIDVALQDIKSQKIVVDNRSSDPTPDIVKEVFRDWTLIQTERNGGYGYAANIGMKNGRSPYVLVMNPDVIVEPNTVVRLLDYMKANTDSGISSCKLLDFDEKTQRSFRRFPSLKFLFYRILDKIKINRGRIYSYKYLMHDSDPDKTQNVDWLLGSFLMIRRKAMEEVGGFDERFFLYCEDVELCARMKQGGWRVTYTPIAQAFHKHQQMSFKKPLSGLWFYHMVSMLRFLSRRRKP